MRRELEAVIHELKQLRQDGVESIYIRRETLDELRSIADDLERNEEETIENIPEEKPEKKKELIPDPPSFDLVSGSKNEMMTELRKRILHDPFAQSQLKEGKKIVPGIGSVDSEIFFCGEAPGAEEEEKGEPFVGPAGQLLTKIIEAMGLNRGLVYIGNIMTYRPPLPDAYGNRPPSLEEMTYCLPYLRAQIAIVQPKVIVALGKTAVDGLLGEDAKRTMGKVRGQWFQFEGIPLIPTYHPSYVLRNGSKSVKKQVWSDMLQALDKAGLPDPNG